MAGSKNVLTLDDKNFDEAIKAGTVLVDFGATWCGPCKALAPIVDKIADEHVGKVKVGALDIDDAPEVTKKYAVKSVPTIIVFKDGQKKGQLTGLTSREKILELLNS